MGNPQDWRERIIGALGAVVAVALVIGGVIGVAAYAAARMAGLTGGDDSSSTSTQSGATSTSPGADQSTPTASPSPAHRRDVEQVRKKDKRPVHHRRQHRAHGLTLGASPRQVHRMARVSLFGAYPGHGGALVVQRREGGHWDRFPVTVVVRAGHFHTWVASGYPGRNLFRVVDPATGTSSAPVTVTVH